MAYIGKEPLAGNFVKLDAITTSATATYALTRNSVAFKPANAESLLVSLNGVTQAPLDAYTVNDTNIVFASALTSSDTIDYILALGEIGAVTTPADSTVDTPKLTTGAVTAAKLATDSVTTIKIADDAVTGAKIENNPTIAGNLTVSGNIVGTLTTVAQPNITSVGTLTGLTSSGDLTVDTSTLKVDAANNRVGIGTASPAFNTEISNSSTSTSLTGLTDAQLVLVNTGTATANQFTKLGFRFADGSYNGQAMIAGVRESATSRATALALYSAPSSDGDPDEVIRISSTAKVGIGTTDPQDPLHTYLASGQRVARFEANNSTSAHIAFKANNTSLMPTVGVKDESFYISTGDAVERMRINSDGRVGIGVAGESGVKLEINAGADGAVGISCRSDGGNGNNRRFNIIPFASGGTYGGGFKIQSRNSSNVFEDALAIDHSKIVTHYAQSNWQVAGGSTALYFKDSSNSNYGVCGFQPATYNGGINTWYTQNSTHFAIKTGGTIGFYMKQDTRQVVLSRNGSTSPFNTTAQLTVNPDYNASKGGIAINTYAYYSGIPGIHIYNNDTNNGRNSEDVLFRRNSSTQGYIRITGASGVNYYSASDYRLKEDNKEITDAIGQVKKLKPYNFKWKNSGDREDGFFAHEVDEVFDYAVDGKKDAVETKKNVVVNKEGIAIADNIKKEDWEKRKADSDNEDNSPKGETTYPTDSTWQEEYEDIKPQVLDPAKLVPILTAALQEAIKRIEVLENK